MMSAVYPSSTSVSGTVAAVNPKGIKLMPQDEWMNFSKYAPDIIPPERGQDVILTLDRQGFVRAVQLADGSSVTSAAPSAQKPASDKDRTITRLAVLKAAAEFGAARPELKSGDVLLIAQSWERWVLRADEPGDDLVDAF